MSSYVYFIRVARDGGPVKIGVSHQPQNRLLTMRACCPDRLELAALLPGDVTLEQRFHAEFRADYLHHEWFGASDRMTRTIAQIVAGEFDIATLPAPALIRPKKIIPKEAIDAGRNSRRVTLLERRGVVIPPHVKKATSTYGLHTDEVERRRKVVADWVREHAADEARGEAA